MYIHIKQDVCCECVCDNIRDMYTCALNFLILFRENSLENYYKLIMLTRCFCISFSCFLIKFMLLSVDSSFSFLFCFSFLFALLGCGKTFLFCFLFYYYYYYFVSQCFNLVDAEAGCCYCCCCWFSCEKACHVMSPRFTSTPRSRPSPLPPVSSAKPNTNHILFYVGFSLV